MLRLMEDFDILRGMRYEFEAAMAQCVAVS